MPEFIEPEDWSPDSQDTGSIYPVDYSVWTALQQMVYHHKMSDIDRLKCVVIDCWTQLSQDILN